MVILDYAGPWATSVHVVCILAIISCCSGSAPNTRYQASNRIGCCSTTRCVADIGYIIVNINSPPSVRNFIEPMAAISTIASLIMSVSSLPSGPAVGALAIIGTIATCYDNLTLGPVLCSPYTSISCSIVWGPCPFPPSITTGVSCA